MASCGAWYYKDVMWKQDSLVVKEAHSRAGGWARNELVALASKNKDAQDFVLALDQIKATEPDNRDPFGCAEPNGVYEMLLAGADINQIFIGLTFETGNDGNGRYLKPCVCCSQWLTAQDRQGTYMVSLKSIYALRDLKKKTTGASGATV